MLIHSYQLYSKLNCVQTITVLYINTVYKILRYILRYMTRFLGGTCKGRFLIFFIFWPSPMLTFFFYLKQRRLLFSSLTKFSKTDTTIPYIIINSRDYNTLKKERKAIKSWGNYSTDWGETVTMYEDQIEEYEKITTKMTQNNI